MKRTHTINKKKDSHKQIWEWEETPEFVDALLKLDTATELLNNIKVPNIHIPNQNLPPKKYKRNEESN